MKTFKLIEFQMENKEKKVVHIPLTDGLIINKENEKNTWLIELFIEEKYANRFDEFTMDDEIPVQVIITKQENNPAFFTMKLVSQKKIDSFYSILLEGQLSKPPFSFAEQLLESLIEKGLTGPTLLSSFQEKIRNQRKAGHTKQLDQKKH
ncbi:YwpF family protein [Fervidibacillus halotolerans]|uniref:YwpF-like family protein n=1 Tax=Fervidibacillus halotolerans TaxID=2980027 RepID=A0A9E8LYK0_9BACI|nr:YwpF family protein [Fervidibacillus halotolerans]WAA12148.1 YwpF-like family protein [Fervidibacillus halotolerans]